MKRFPRGMITRVCFCSSERETQYYDMQQPQETRVCPVPSVVRLPQFLLGMVATVLTDIVHFGIFYPGNDLAIGKATDVFRFSLGMAILNLLLKPVSCFFVYQMYRERGGDYNVNFGESSTITGFFNFSEEIPDYLTVNGHFLDN